MKNLMIPMAIAIVAATIGMDIQALKTGSEVDSTSYGWGWLTAEIILLAALMTSDSLRK